MNEHIYYIYYSNQKTPRTIKKRANCVCYEFNDVLNKNSAIPK